MYDRTLGKVLASPSHFIRYRVLQYCCFVVI
uniref:Uncharacterized protein n=1 Tax=Arundo donax TaxID=35708 RepID=A0A0A9CAQ1_ARUDO